MIDKCPICNKPVDPEDTETVSRLSGENYHYECVINPPAQRLKA